MGVVHGRGTDCIMHVQAGYHSAHHVTSFVVDLVTYQVDYLQCQLLNTSNQALFNLRRLAFSPLMPMKVSHSL